MKETERVLSIGDYENSLTNPQIKMINIQRTPGQNDSKISIKELFSKQEESTDGSKKADKKPKVSKNYKLHLAQLNKNILKGSKLRQA